MSEMMEWFAQAACKGKTELFFTPAHSENNRIKRRRELAAIAICETCPSMLKCRAYARENNELGIWGGETEYQRWERGYLTASSGVRRSKANIHYQRRLAAGLIDDMKVDA